MLSRVANHVYWLGRYLERAESMSRTMSVHDQMLMDLSEFERTPTWYQLIAINSNEKIFAEHFDEVTEKNVLQFLTSSLDNPSSIANSLAGVRYNLRTCRSIVPTSVYELANQVCLEAAEVSGRNVTHAQRRDFLRSVEHQLLAVSGAASGGMSRNEAFLFMRIGQVIEQADMTSRILDVRSASLIRKNSAEILTPYENAQWVAILQSLKAFQMYMSEARRPINGPEVLNYVLKNRQHPKSVRFCIQRLAGYLRRLAGTDELQFQVAKLLSYVDQADVLQLARDQEEMHQFMDSLQQALSGISSSFSTHFFPDPTQERIEDNQHEEEKPDGSFSGKQLQTQEQD